LVLKECFTTPSSAQRQYASKLRLRHPIAITVANPYKIIHEQVVPRPLEEVFSFFSRAENLEAITPEWLSFRVLSVAPKPIRKGTVIEYRLSLRGLPLRWTSEIREWEPPHRFVDVQLSGPYKLWHHTHLFIAAGQSTRLRDEVLYDLPLGAIGRLIHRLVVGRDVQQVFDFREARIRAIFG
jgi:ligand-binding SRPBCC domain-containing protein